MKVSLYYYPYQPRSEDPLQFADMEVLPLLGQVIRYTNYDDHYEDGIVKEIRWDVTAEASSFAIVLVERIE